MAATASITIVVDDQQATQAFRNVNAEAAKLGPAMQPVQKISDSTFSSMEGGAKKARESAALLSEEMGIRLPRALRGVLAESSLIGPALNAAFSGLAVGGLIAAAATALMSLAETISSVKNSAIESARAIQKEALDAELSLLESGLAKQQELRIRTETAGANELQKLDAKYHAERQALIQEELKAEEQARLTGETDVVTLANNNLLQLDKAYAAEKKQLLLKEADDVREAKDAEVAVSKKGSALILADAQVALDRINAAEHQGTMLHADAEARRALLHAQTDEKILQFDKDTIERSRALDAEGNRALLQAEASTYGGRQQIEAEYLVKLNEITEREVTETLALKKQGINREVDLDDLRLAAKMDYNRKLLDLERQRADEELQIETAASIAMLPPWQRADAQIVADANARIQKIREMEAKDATFRERGEREVSAVIQKEWAERVDNMASQLESLYNDITSGGIGKFFLDQFKKMIFRMVAEWALGMNQMRAASQQSMGSGGGILGAIFGSLGLGGIFGGGGSNAQGGAGPTGGIPSDVPASNIGDVLGPIIGNVGLSAGQGSVPGGVLPSGSTAGGGSSGFAGLMGKLFSPSQIAMLGATGGLALLQNGYKRGGALGVLESIGGGFMTGASIGFMLGGPFGAGIGAFVGTIAGAISGLVGAIFGHSTKKARLAIEANIKAQAQAIEDGYNLFQIDWSSSRSQLEALRQQGVDALKQAGVKDIDRSRVGHVDHWIDKAEKEIDATQAERNARSALTFGPAQFRVGGFVGSGGGGAVPSWFAASAMHFAGGGAVPAFLHPGEYVMRPEAVSAIGRGNLERMNAGGGAGGDTHLHFEINAIDAKSFDSYLANGGMKSIAKAWHRARMEGGF